MNYTVQALDHHRNGVSGSPFWVALCTEKTGHDTETRYLATFQVETYDKTGEWVSPRRDEDGLIVAMFIKLDEAHAGNIHMFPHLGDKATGGAAKRGDRMIGYFWAALVAFHAADQAAIAEHRRVEHEALLAEWDTAVRETLAALGLPDDDAHFRALKKNSGPWAIRSMARATTRPDEADYLRRIIAEQISDDADAAKAGG